MQPLNIMNKILASLIISLAAVKIASGCLDKCYEEANACDRDCMEESCKSNYPRCTKLGNCSANCLEKLSNSQCDAECNILECLFDGYFCKPECTKDCNLIENWGNGQCDISCNNEECGWDGGDCTKRQLSTCGDCSVVTSSNPYTIFVGVNEIYKDLGQAFAEGICCQYNLIYVKENTKINTDYIENMVLDIENAKEVTIKGAETGLVVSLEKGFRILIKGSTVKLIGLGFSSVAGYGDEYFTFEVSNNGTILFSDMHFQDNINNVVKVYEGSIYIESSTFTGRFAGLYLFHAVECKIFCLINAIDVDLNNIEFNTRVYGSITNMFYSFITAKNTQVTLNSISFSNIEVSSSLIILNECDFTISKITVKNILTLYLIFAINSDNFLLDSTSVESSDFYSSFFKAKFCSNGVVRNFISKDTSTYDGIFVFQGTEVKITDSSIKEAKGTSISCENESYLTITNTDIINTKDIQGSGIYCQDSYINADKIYIKGMKSSLVGGIRIERKSDLAINSIQNSKIENCSAQDGAGIYIDDAGISIFNSEFYDNNAEQKGGAVYIQGIFGIPSVTINKCKFENNIASSGGSIYWTNAGLYESENIFVNNSASYGNDLATSVVSLEYTKEVLNVIPGTKINQCLNFILKDYYNQTVVDDNTSVIALLHHDANSNSSIYGVDFLTSVKGQMDFCNFKVFGFPGSTLNITADLYTSNSGLSAIISVNVSLFLSECNLGEVITESRNECKKCEDGYYSFYNNEITCHKCPLDATCTGSTLYPISGHWHSSAISTSIFMCINEEACNSDGTCAKGYSGNLCAVCDKDYVLSSSNTCKKCPTKTDNIILMAFLFIFFTAVICYIIYRTYEDAYELKLYHSVLIKILMNYFQIMMLTSVLKMRWPSPFYQLISIQEQIGSSTGKLLSADCLIQETTDKSPFYVNILLNFLLPLILGTIITIIWSIVALFKGVQKIVKPFITSVVVVFFIIHPGISNTSLSIFSCHQISEGEYWNVNSFDIQCYTDDYAKDYYAIFVLGLIFWTIGMPAVAYTMLRKNRKDLELPAIKAKYGFLYHGYHSNRYYWEFVIMCRKILIISIALLLRSASVSLQLIFVLLVLIGALVLNLYYKPFELHELNRTENFSIGLSIICLTSGLMIESQASYTWHIILFIILIISNFLFFCYFAKRVYQAVGHYLWSTCPHIARTICPRAPRPRIKIKEIIQKETRRNSKKHTDYEPQSGFVDSNREVVIQLCNMRNYVDFYNEVLAARFSSEDIETIERRENALASQETNLQNEPFDIVPIVQEPRPFYKRIFNRKKKKETVQDKINNIRKKSFADGQRSPSDVHNDEEDMNLQD